MESRLLIGHGSRNFTIPVQSGRSKLAVLMHHTTGVLGKLLHFQVKLSIQSLERTLRLNSFRQSLGIKTDCRAFVGEGVALNATHEVVEAYG